MTIVLASNNAGKIKEIQELLDGHEILSLEDIGFLDEIVEDGDTFLDNALIKAKTVSNFLKEKGLNYPVLADDSGLCVPSLGGKPGIYSARYAGDHDAAASRKKLISRLQNQNDRSAYFICQVIYYQGDDYKSFEGRTYGTILEEEKGSNGFGYDSIFLSDDLHKSFGESSDEEKNKVSHRGRAIQKFVDFIKEK